MSDQSQSDSQKAADAAATTKAAAEAKLKAEADIKKLLSNKDKDDKLEDLSNKEVLEIVADAFDTAIDANTKIAVSEMSKPLDDINSKLNNLQKYLLQKEAATGVEAAKAKFGDFDDYKEGVSKVLEMYPGIAIEDAYVLAKADKAKDVPPKGEMESEKPISLATRAENAQTNYDKAQDKEREKSNDKPSRVASFRNSLSVAAERIISKRTK